MLLYKNGQLSKVNIKDVRVVKSKINVKDLSDMNTNNNGIAYSFGYISDDIIEIEIKIDAKEFDISQLTLNIVENEFFKEVGAYITYIEYDNEWLDTEGDDIDGDYFNSTFFKP